MPEGDTIFRAASTLSRALAGKKVLKSSIAGLAGSTVVSVESRGKNLLIHFDNGSALHSHMRMNGSWHIYRTGERWQKPERFARAVIAVDGFVAVCFHAPVLRMLTESSLKADQKLRSLGPDVLQEPSIGEVVDRFRQHPELEIGVAILRQQILAGVGNVYKSETLFLEKTSPFARVSDLADADLARLVSRASDLMNQNLAGEVRRTRSSDSHRLWVYRRKGKPCFRCGAKISMRRQGPDRRSSYYCPACQKVDAPSGDSDSGS